MLPNPRLDQRGRVAAVLRRHHVSAGIDGEADEEIAPERLLVAETLLLVDGLDAALMDITHAVAAEIDRLAP